MQLLFFRTISDIENDGAPVRSSQIFEKRLNFAEKQLFGHASCRHMQTISGACTSQAMS